MTIALFGRCSARCWEGDGSRDPVAPTGYQRAEFRVRVYELKRGPV